MILLLQVFVEELLRTIVAVRLSIIADRTKANAPKIHKDFDFTSSLNNLFNAREIHRSSQLFQQ